MLEAHHFTGPSQVMWAIHDDIRAHIKQAREAFAGGDPVNTSASLKKAIQAMRDMIYKEDHILFPASLEMLTQNEWIKVKEGEADIGYEFRSSTDLIFDPGTLIESLSQANPGSDPSTVTPSNLLTTDGDDVEEVLTALSGNPAEFVRARTIPPEP